MSEKGTLGVRKMMKEIMMVMKKITVGDTGVYSPEKVYPDKKMMKGAPRPEHETWRIREFEKRGMERKKFENFIGFQVEDEWSEAWFLMAVAEMMSIAWLLEDEDFAYEEYLSKWDN